MDLAAFSPRKLQLLNQSSPRTPARKRSLFPSNSPQSNDDLGLISELYSDDSDVYSPPFASPASSITCDGNDSSSPMRSKFDKILKVTNRLEFNNMPRNSPLKAPRKMYFGKENIGDNSKTAKKSPKKLSNKFFEREKINFTDKYFTCLESPEKQEIPVQFEMKSSDKLITPRKTVTSGNNGLRRSPRSASKLEVTIKPNNFYGNLAPILATNQTNRIQGMKCVFRPVQRSRAKTKLLFEEKPATKRERSKSTDVIREAKRRKTVFTGVRHCIPKPVKHISPPVVKTNQESVREKARKITDLSRTPYGMKKNKLEGWEYTLRFTKPLRYEESQTLGTKRKFFKTSLMESPSLSPEAVKGIFSPAVPKKRKLLDTRKSYLSEDVLDSQQASAVDVSDLLEDQDGDLLQDKPEVDDILLRLEEEDGEEKKKEAEREILMNILEDSPIKMTAIDSLSNCTASLDLNDSDLGSGCSRFSMEDNMDQNTPQRVITSSSTKSVSGSSTNPESSRKKWYGVGESQLQIDAGQVRFGAYQCRECGMIYQAGEAEDEKQHMTFHNNLNVLRHAGWKNENIVGRFGLDYVMVITGDDPKNWQQKALEVIAFVDKYLGSFLDVPTVMHNQKVFLYISEKKVVGCMVACPNTHAYKMISSESDVDICSEESYKVRCGVSRMWTLYSHRRQGIASKLLDTVRRNFMYGYILSNEEISFSIPTPDGKRFATKYMNSPNFLVYVPGGY